jgi:ferrochelatase
VDRSFDALLLVSFGGPEGPDDVVPFLENVTRGRGISPERLKQVGEHYFQFGGVSPINGQNRRLLAALSVELSRRGIEIPVYWGNRNWQPYISDTVEQMQQDGIKRAVAFFTSAYSSYSGCRQYRENLAAARIEVGDSAPDIERLGPYFNHPGFIDPFVDNTITALAELSPTERTSARLVFTTHSIPSTMAESSGVPTGAYVRQHREVATLVAQQVALRTGSTRQWDLVYQSRSGPPQVPWLEPDVEDHLGSLHEAGVRAVVVVPIGFVSDHMEVVWDLDTQAVARAAALGMSMSRARTPGDDPRFVSMVADLLTERLDRVEPTDRLRWGAEGASPDRCAPGCCPNPRGLLPAVGENP